MELFTVSFAVCLFLGLGCFWMFGKCIDWFENI